MPRTLPPLGEEWVKEIEGAWERPQEDWARQPLLVVRLIAQHELTTAQIAKVAGDRTHTLGPLTMRDWAGCWLLPREWLGVETMASSRRRAGPAWRA